MVLPSQTRPDKFTQPVETLHLGSAIVDTDERTPVRNNLGSWGFDWAEDAIFVEIPAESDHETELHLGNPGGITPPRTLSFSAKFVGDFTNTTGYVGIQNDADDNRIAVQRRDADQQTLTQVDGSFTEHTVSAGDWSSFTQFQIEWADDDNDGVPDVVRFYVDGTAIDHITAAPDARLHPTLRVFSDSSSSSSTTCRVLLRDLRTW